MPSTRKPKQIAKSRKLVLPEAWLTPPPTVPAKPAKKVGTTSQRKTVASKRTAAKRRRRSR